MGTPETRGLLRSRHAKRAAPEPRCRRCAHVLVPDGAPAKLLEVARAMGVPFFSTEQLTIAAWLKLPELFGLPGHEKHYPDNHRVLSMLCGKRGLVSRGYVRRLAGGLLQVITQ